MIIDGERIKELLKGATAEVILCAPFIKARVLGTLLHVVPEGLPVRIITRWHPAEIAAGVSDLAVYDVAAERPHTRLGLIQNLHAKLYLADDDCLVGSANLTASALGWSGEPNLEILLPARRAQEQIAQLLDRLDDAATATQAIRDGFERQASEILTFEPREARDLPPYMEGVFSVPWLPRCATPDKLYAIYKDPGTAAVVEGTLVDARADLNDLLPPPNLSRESFNAYIRSSLSELPSFRHVLTCIPSRLTDAQGLTMIAGLRPNHPELDHQKQWHIVRDWIGEFFQDQFEVAPDSYVIRLRSH